MTTPLPSANFQIHLLLLKGLSRPLLTVGGGCKIHENSTKRGLGRGNVKICTKKKKKKKKKAIFVKLK